MEKLTKISVILKLSEEVEERLAEEKLAEERLTEEAED